MKSKARFFSWTIRIVGAFLLTIGIYSPAVAADTPPDLIVAKTHVGDFAQGDNDKEYTITVTNNGDGDTNGTLITLTDTLPAGLSAQSISGDSGWTCPIGDISALTVLTCTRTTPLAAHTSSIITLIVDVAYNAGTGAIINEDPIFLRTVTNTVNVTGGGDLDASNIGTDVTRIVQKPDLRVTAFEFRNLSDETITQILPDESFYIHMTIENRGGGDTGNFYPGVFLDNKPNYGKDHDEPSASPVPLNLGEITSFSGYQTTPEGANEKGCRYYDPSDLINEASEVVNTERGNYFKPDYIPNMAAGTTTTADVLIAYPEANPYNYTDPIYDTDDVRTGLKAGAYNIYLYADPNCVVTDESYEDNNSLGPITVTVGSTIGCAAPMTGTPIFGDVPVGHWAREYVEAMYTCGYTAGCSSSPLLYCPSNGMTRVESSVFILRGNFGASYTPPSSGGSFGDNWGPGPWGQKWAQGLLNAGLTAGCSSSPLLFCPFDATPRVQLAVFGVRLRHGSSFVPPPATGNVFADMTNPAYFGTKWAEQAYLDGIIPSCGTSGGKPMFCPDSLVDRALAAYTVAKAKYLVP